MLHVILHSSELQESVLISNHTFVIVVDTKHK